MKDIKVLGIDLVKRIWEHKSKFVLGFTEKYNVTLLVYFETIAT